MRISLFMLFVCVFQMIAVESGAQNSIIKLEAESLTVGQLINQIEKQTDYLVIFRNQEVDTKRMITVHKTSGGIMGYLEEAFKGTDIACEFNDKYILLVKKTGTDKQALLQQQTGKRITGIVTDMSGEPIIGANVSIKGTSTGTITDVDGKFSFNVPGNALIQISYIGYLTQEFTIGNKTNFSIKLRDDLQNLEEVVVVGYGVQKKANLSGSVGVVDVKKIENRPICNVGQALQGTVGNLNITNSSGQANATPDINIRGVTSINGGSPLIVIDGLISDAGILNRMNPSDIESVSVLKDAASSAIYGSRAAFGVLLVTTKSGKQEKLSINYNSNYAFRHITKLTELERDPYTVASITNQMGYPWYSIFTQEELEYAKRRSEDPKNVSPFYLGPNGTYSYFDSVDWYKEVYRNAGFATTQNVDISGKTDRVTYFFSASYLFQDGMLKNNDINDKYNRYNLRAKLDFKLTNWWHVGGNLSFASSDYKEPSYLEDLYWFLGRENTLVPAYNPDGTWTHSNALTGPTILAKLTDGGRNTTQSTDFVVQLSTKIDVVKDIFTIRGNFGMNRYENMYRSHLLPVAKYDGPDRQAIYTRSTSRADNKSTLKNHLLFDIYGDFNKTFNKKHFTQVLVGFNQEENKFSSFKASRSELISNSLPSIELATGVPVVNETIYSEAIRGAFFRLNYIFDNRYIVEFNGRYDGTSSFPKKDRFVFNPSASLGWVASQEKFFAPLTSVVNHLKVRLSYGSLGNQATGEGNVYRYIPTMTAGKTSVILDGSQPTYISAPGLVAGTLTWETVTTANIGLDVNFLNNRLTTSADVYRRDTKNMLSKGKTLPTVLGTSEPEENAANLKTTGWEVSVGWKDQCKLAGKEFNYGANFVLSDNRTFITKYDNPTGSLSSYYVGQEIGEIWGAKTLGFFTSEEDIRQHADQSAVTSYPGTRPLGPGDLKFEDRNDDHKIDYGKWTLDDHGDYYIIGNKTPRFNFGLGLNADWNGFDFQAFFQGVGKRDYMPDNSEVNFWGVFFQPWSNITVGNMDHWTEDNPNAYFPRLKAYVAEETDREAGVPQTKYLQNAAYLRFKNLTLGYTLPKTLTDKWNVSRVRIYFSGENIAEFSGLHKYYRVDPENLGGEHYPFQRSFSFGLNVSF